MKFVHIYFLLEPGLSALNMSDRKPNIQGHENANVLKTYYYRGKPYPYISGQAYRRWLRETLDLMDGEGKYTTILDDINYYKFKEGIHYKVSKDKKANVTLKKKIFEDYPGLDLFGYMISASGNTSIVRRSPVMNTFVLGVIGNIIKDIKTKHTDKVMGTSNQLRTSLSYSELAEDVFYGSMSIEVDRIGKFSPEELSVTEKVEGIDFGDNYRKEMVRKLLTAFFTLTGGANRARALGNVSPRYAILTVTEKGNNVFPSMRPPIENKVKVPESFVDYAKKYYGNVFVYSLNVGQDSKVSEDVEGVTDYEDIIDKVVKKL